MSNRSRLHAFYSKYNPEKIDEIDTVLLKYKGKEDTLFQALIRKYGPEDAQPVEVQSPVNAATDVDPMLKIRLTEFYEKYNPDKVSSVEETLIKYKGKEVGLFEALVKKYGPEDGDEEEEDDEELVYEQVVYCPIDTLPPSFCEYGPCFEECKPWLLENTPDLYLQKYNRTVAQLAAVEQEIENGVEGLSLIAPGGDLNNGKKEKKNTRKLGIKDKKNTKVEKANATITIERIQRGKRKYVTHLVGLDDFETNCALKDCAKKLGKRFACSGSVNKLDNGGVEILIQGDCSYDLPDLLVSYWKIPSDKIYFLEKGKLQPAL